ncbi:ABC transporter substrate-binding protein, partial [Microvirga sp. 3-52]|nr:ABC transporter substrate-binding protein [Microvirga sp. 3-52]
MMKRKFSLFLLAGLIMVVAGCSANADPAVESENSDGDRIIATTVAVTEIMDALEIDLVAVPTSYKDLPKRYDGLTEIGNPMNPDMEIILSLKPTEVLSVSTLKSDLDEVFSGRNINTSYLNLQTLENMQNEILALGERYDRQEQAGALIQKFEGKLEEIKLK